MEELSDNEEPESDEGAERLAGCCLLNLEGDFMLSELQPRKILFHLFQMSSEGEMKLSAGAVQSHYSVIIHLSHCSTKATVEKAIQQPVYLGKQTSRKALILSYRF